MVEKMNTQDAPDVKLAASLRIAVVRLARRLRVQRMDSSLTLTQISALVTLYSNACLAGHRFSLTNVSARVAQILSVVGLDRYLLSQNTVLNSQCEPCIERPAA